MDLPLVFVIVPSHMGCDFVQVLGDEEKRERYDRGEDLEEQHGGGGGGFHQEFHGGGQTFSFQFEGGFPGGGFHF